MKIEIPFEKVESPASVLKLSGAAIDADGAQLAVPSRTAHVEMRVAEWVMPPSGNTEMEPKDGGTFQKLDPAEYYLYETLQPAKNGIATKPYTFLFQPDRNRRPFFPHPGIFEVQFRFLPIDDAEDIVELLFTCYVTPVSAPRKVSF